FLFFQNMPKQKNPSQKDGFCSVSIFVMNLKLL
ncbi:MAG: hypothetical protein ACI9Z4_002103, partial [Polaribacter sp.]